MKLEVRTATHEDKEAIAALIHDTYALELGQYEVNEPGQIIDRRHDTNHYIVAYAAEELIGMLAITWPSTAPFSTLKRLPAVSEEIQNNLHRTAEIRLLAVKPEYRGQGVFDRLMQAAIMTCYGHDVDRVLISAIVNRVSLYEFMGFCPLGEPVVEGKAVYLPMLITSQSLQASPYMQKLRQRTQVPAAT